MRLLVQPADSGGCGFYRIRVPAKTLAFYKMVERVTEAMYYLPQGQLEEIKPDRIFVQRQTEPATAAEILRYKKAGMTVIQDLDDLLWQAPLTNMYRFYFKGPQKKALFTGLKACDFLVASTVPLQEEMISWTRREVRLLPNLISGQFFRDPLPRTSDKLRVGWAGSSSHKSDLEILRSVILETYKRFQWVFLAYAPDFVRPLIEAGHVEVYGPTKVEDYLPALVNMSLDVAVAPLELNRFNECKSNLKSIEFSCLGVPIITSDVYPYKDNPNYKIPGRSKDWKKWIDALESYEDESLRMRHAQRAREFADNFRLETASNVEIIRKAWLD